ncbi:MFS transporter [Caldimonas sp. KR1-144]|uniref:MFS transporter n=1 Tax=Caldimonas sp. KR1-144 TaxID=3400911 RepID=UPI003C04F400
MSTGARPIGTWAGLRYGALGLPLAFLALPLYVNLPDHYARTHDVPLATLGAVLLATRFVDAGLDPFIGPAVDRLFARSVRSAWFAAAAAATVAAGAFAALFLVPAGASLAMLAVGLVAAYVSYSVLSIVHQAWGTRLGGDALQRARVTAWREGLGVIGVLLASVLPARAGLDATSALLAIAMLLGLWGLARGPSADARGTAHGGSDWRLPLSDARFRGLLAVFMLNGIAAAVPATLLVFFVRDRLQLPGSLPLFLGAYFAAAVLAVWPWLRAVRRHGLAACWLAAMLLAAASFAGTLALGAGDGVGFLAVCVASGMALGADLVLPGALLTGVVQRSGHALRAEGAYAGWWTAATKLNLGLAAGVALPALALAGYAPGTRDAQALQALAAAYVAVPCALKLAAAALLWRWRHHDLQQGVRA